MKKDIQNPQNKKQELMKEIEQEYQAIISEYSEELLTIKNKSSRLFSKTYSLNKELSDSFRAMCTLSQTGTNNRQISSHRKIIGPVIVFFKKILYQIIDPYLKTRFDGVSACLCKLIKEQARLEEKLSNK